jgi:hypothetical protein
MEVGRQMAHKQLVRHHNNMPAYTALAVQQFSASKNMMVVSHPSYLPDLAPCDFLIFPKMKIKLKGVKT